ncbi:MAG: hypothetical protein HUJ56_05015, partial [Erysipelotrichaceae bacterium]|nr:hypothetical protein [Erysipelotrichaceae bacterium]
KSAFILKGETGFRYAYVNNGVCHIKGADKSEVASTNLDITYIALRPNQETVQKTLNNIIFNNGWFNGVDKMVIGADYTDATKCGCKLLVNNAVTDSKPYMGLCSQNGNVTGEPIYITYSDGWKICNNTVMTNRSIKWELAITGADYTTICNRLKEKVDEPTSYPLQEWNIIPLNESIKTELDWATIGKYTINGSSFDLSRYNNTRNLLNPSVGLGNFWDNISDPMSDSNYDIQFPNMQDFTNIADNRNKTYMYGEDFCYYLGQLRNFTRVVTVIEQHEKLHTKFYKREVVLVKDEYNSLSSSLLDNINFKTDSSAPWKSVINPDVMATSQEWVQLVLNYVRPITVSSSVLKNKSWPRFGWQVEYNIGDIPFRVDIGNVGYHYYNNNLICISMNGIAITPPSTGMSQVYDVYKTDSYCYIIADKKIYYLKKITSKDDIKINKVADYMFATNLISLNNVFKENRDGSLELQTGFIAYFNEMKYNGISNGAYRDIEDGSTPNDTWFEACGNNVNLDDKYAGTSGLLPAINVPFYLNSNDMESFNSNVMTINNPIFTPDIPDALKEINFDVYYTHSLETTDITYKYSTKNNMYLFDVDKANTSWWITSDVIIFPLGIGSDISGINYIASTVKLPGNYSARLYTQNNNAFLCYNIMTETYFGGTIFTIYGSSYYYDGQAIYYVGGTNNLVANDFRCYAIGMKFLNNSGTEAYFYSYNDKAIFIFSGSNTMTRSIEFARMSNIVDSAFSSCNQTLFILTEDSLYAVNPQSSALFEIENGKQIQTTTMGPAIITDNGYELFTINPNNNECVPLDLETMYIGDATSQFKFNFIELMLYNGNEQFENKPIKLIAKTTVKQNNDYKEESVNVIINPNDWKGDVYRFRLTPKNNIGNAAKFSIYTDDYVSIQSIQMNYSKVSDTSGGVV